MTSRRAWWSGRHPPAHFAGGEFGLPCILIIRRLEEGRRHDTAQLNELLREHGVSV